MACVIRRWRVSDQERLAEMLSNPKVLDNLRDGLPYPYTPENARDFIREVCAASPGSLYAFAITVQGRVVGSLTIYRQQNVHARSGELGYYIAQECWGQGLATSAIGQACRLVFAQSDLLRIFAQPFGYNTASCRALEKAGFTHEGTLRQHAVKNNRVLDVELYALLREDCPRP